MMVDADIARLRGHIPLQQMPADVLADAQEKPAHTA